MSAFALAGVVFVLFVAAAWGVLALADCAAKAIDESENEGK